jgi:hypothetical protein
MKAQISVAASFKPALIFFKIYIGRKEAILSADSIENINPQTSEAIPFNYPAHP